MEMAFAAFDQIISILPRSVETYYIFGHWLEEKNLLLSAITQQRTALLIQASGLYNSPTVCGGVPIPMTAERDKHFSLMAVFEPILSE